MCEPEQAAFPVPDNWVGLGLTKREEFAKAIAAGLAITPYKYYREDGTIDRVALAKEAIAIADELLAQLEAEDHQSARKPYHLPDGSAIADEFIT